MKKSKDLSEILKVYLDNSILIDVIIGVLFILFFYLSNCYDFYKTDFFLKDDYSSFSASLISVSSTLLGFLLTIITVIITFKRSYNKSDNSDNKPKTVFDPINKIDSFYTNDNLTKNVVKVFANAAFEISAILFILLFFQFSTLSIPIHLIGVLYFTCLILIILTIIRCLHIFKLFLNIHS